MTREQDYADIVALKCALGKAATLAEVTRALVRRAPVQDKDNRDAAVRRWINAVRISGEVAP